MKLWVCNLSDDGKMPGNVAVYRQESDAVALLDDVKRMYGDLTVKDWGLGYAYYDKRKVCVLTIHKEITGE